MAHSSTALEAEQRQARQADVHCSFKITLGDSTCSVTAEIPDNASKTLKKQSVLRQASIGNLSGVLKAASDGQPSHTRQISLDFTGLENHYH